MQMRSLFTTCALIDGKTKIFMVKRQKGMYKNLVFSGGGISCVSSMACAKTLKNELSHVDTFVGTSAGAVIAALVAMDADEKLTYSTFSTMIDKYKPVQHIKFSNILESFGTVSSETFVKPVVSELIMNPYNMIEMCQGKEPSTSPPTFSEFAKTTGKNLIIATVNISRQQTEFFCVDTHPNQCIVEAISASCAVPLIFSPISIDGDLHVDAGITDNLPVAALPETAFINTLCIDTIPPKEGERKDIKDLFTFFKETLQTVVKECNVRNQTNGKFDRISIFNSDRGSMHMESFLGNTSQATIDSLYATGMKAAKKFMETKQ